MNMNEVAAAATVARATTNFDFFIKLDSNKKLRNAHRGKAVGFKVEDLKNNRNRVWR